MQGKVLRTFSVPVMSGKCKELSNSADEHVSLHALFCALTKAEQLLYLGVGRTLTLNPDVYCKQSVAFSEGIL